MKNENIAFTDLGLSEATLDAITQKGFLLPTPVQAKAIPLLLENKHDLIVQAHTGTGKTAAFALPILDRLKETEQGLHTLVMVPTRELALQVTKEMQSLRPDKDVKIVTVYGGQAIFEQIKKLRAGAQIVVGTPGRIMDHLERKTLSLETIKTIVLDEADEMLNMGFYEDMETIFSYTPEKKRVVLFSATVPPRIRDMAQKFMKNPQELRLPSASTEIALTEHLFVEVYEEDKVEALLRLIDITIDFYGIIFAKTRLEADELSALLNKRGYRTMALHGEIQQSSREKILNSFRKRDLTILIATDVAARGIDVENLSHVINFSVPHDPESYTHRIGRTGRNQKQGTAITIITPREFPRLQRILKITKFQAEKIMVPDPEEIIHSKQQVLAEKLSLLMETSDLARYKKFSAFLTKNFPAETIISALLHLSHSALFRPEDYAVIKPLKRSMERTKPAGREQGDRRSQERRSFGDRNTPRERRERYEKKEGSNRNDRKQVKSEPGSKETSPRKEGKPFKKKNELKKMIEKNLDDMGKRKRNKD